MKNKLSELYDGKKYGEFALAAATEVNEHSANAQEKGMSC